MLRLLIAALFVLLLCDPEWRVTVHPKNTPVVAVLWDDSKSMATLDTHLPAALSPGREVVSRAEFVQKLLASGFWKSLADAGKNEVITRAIASPPANGSGEIHGTDLEAPLSALLREQDNLRAVVLVSDGDANSGQPPIVAAQKMHLRGVPLFAVPAGSTTRLPDLELLAVSAPTYGIVGENVQIPFTIRSSLARQVRTVVHLRDSGGREVSKDIVLPPGSETYDSIIWKLQKDTANLTLSFPSADGEQIAGNNSRSFTIAAKPEKIRVLILETLPRWEYRFLHNALSRDPGVQVSCLLLHPQLGPGGGKDYLTAFPEKPAELSTYDVIFIGDIGGAPGQLTAEQCGMIRGLVENQASGIVFLPGPQGNQATLLQSPLADLLPVIAEENRQDGHRETTPAPLTLTTEGRSSLLTMLGENEEQNAEIWRRLPGFHWHAAVLKSKAGAEVLAVHGNRRGPYGPVPLIVTKPAGNGKALFMGIDSAWRWRRGVEDLYHYRFWGQVARWMSYQRNMAAGRNIRLFFHPERPEPGNTVTVNANAFDANGAPLENGTISLDITSPDGKSRRIDLTKNNSAWGSFSSSFKIDQPGTWKLRAISSATPDAPLETTLLAQGADLEKTGQPARHDVLEEMARITNGRMLSPENLVTLAADVAALPAPRPLETHLPLRTHWAVPALLVVLLGGFWTMRKLNGAF